MADGLLYHYLVPGFQGPGALRGWQVLDNARERDGFKTLITDDRSSFGGKGRSETATYNYCF